MRRTVALALLIVALTAGAAWLVARLAPAPPPPRPAAGPVEPNAADAAEPAPAAHRAVDPEEQARLESLREAREGYAALRDAFPEGRPSPAAAARLQPLVASLWPPPAHPEVACRGAICRVLPIPAPAGWREALATSEGVRALVDRLAVDPDAATTPAYLVLAPPREVAALEPPPRDPAPVKAALATPAASAREPEPHEAAPPPPGRAEEFLRGVETAVRASPELAACLAAAEPGTAVELRLVLDEGDLTYRLGAGLAPQPAHCASAVLDALTAAPAPPGLGPGERTVHLERPAEHP